MFYAVVCATLTSFYELSRNYSKCSVAVEENLHQFISFVINFDRGEARRLPFVGVLNIFVIFSFLRRRLKKALLRVNDRGGDWRTCILALCRACVSLCFVRTYVPPCRLSSARTSADNLRRYGDTP